MYWMHRRSATSSIWCNRQYGIYTCKEHRSRTNSIYGFILGSSSILLQHWLLLLQWQCVWRSIYDNLRGIQYIRCEGNITVLVITNSAWCQWQLLYNPWYGVPIRRWTTHWPCWAFLLPRTGHKFVPKFSIDLQLWDNLKYHFTYSGRPQLLGNRQLCGFQILSLWQ